MDDSRSGYYSHTEYLYFVIYSILICKTIYKEYGTTMLRRGSRRSFCWLLVRFLALLVARALCLHFSRSIKLTIDNYIFSKMNVALPKGWIVALEDNPDGSQVF